MFEIKGKYTSAKVIIDYIDEPTMSQIYEMVNHPAAENPVSIMPDTHCGKGCVIGFTMKMGEKIVPNWIGVDIGCSVSSYKINVLKNEINNEILSLLDNEIRRSVPMGMSIKRNQEIKIADKFIAFLKTKALESNSAYGVCYRDKTRGFIEEKIRKIGMNLDRFYNSIGTLGGGNHFCELCKDTNNNIWLIIHTGSRNFGKVVCDYFNKIGIEKLSNIDISDFIKAIKEKADRGEIRHKDIEYLIKNKKEKNKRDFDIKTSAYIENEDKDTYLKYMFLAQVYAEFNHVIIAEEIINQFSRILDKKIKTLEKIQSVHNYISFDDNTIRKGAIQSYIGQKILIPLNMRDGTLICEGKSNHNWNNSAPHGAGRILSRRAAKSTISLDDYEKSMEGIFSTSVCESTIDESPMAYKDGKMIEKTIIPTATILDKIIPIYNIKAK